MTETCTDSRTNSLPASSPVFRYIQVARVGATGSRGDANPNGVLHRFCRVLSGVLDGFYRVLDGFWMGFGFLLLFFFLLPTRFLGTLF